ncbi:uncharacterized protein METZ01_LOCUS481827, partial [marine metagenome]
MTCFQAFTDPMGNLQKLCRLPNLQRSLFWKVAWDDIYYLAGPWRHNN